MTPRPYIILLLCFSCITTSVCAKVYKKVHPDGTVEYTDQPVDGSEALQVQPSNTYKSPDSLPPLESSTIKQETFKYTEIKITSPKDQDTIRNNGGNLSVSGMITPQLRNNHKVQLVMDGNALDSPIRGLSFTLQNLERGEHSFHLQIVDENKKVFQAGKPITVFLHRNVAK